VKNIAIIIGVLVALLLGSYAYGIQEEVIGFLKGLALALAGITLLVVVHELGHFLAARMFGIRVETFSIGLPPKIFGIERGETTYQIGALFIGGYVKIVGQMGEAPEDQQIRPGSEKAQEALEQQRANDYANWDYRSKPVWQRFIVMIAGVVFNVILAILIFSSIKNIYGDIRHPVEKSQGIYVPQNSIGEKIGLKTGDKLISLNGEKYPYMEDFIIQKGLVRKEAWYMVKRGGDDVRVDVPRLAINYFSDKEINKVGFYLGTTNVVLVDTAQNMPAAKAGIQNLDKIIKLDSSPIRYFEDIRLFADNLRKEREGKDIPQPTISVTHIRNTDTLYTPVTLNEFGQFGIRPDTSARTDTLIQYSFFESFSPGIKLAYETASGHVASLTRLAEPGVQTGKLISGPLKILSLFKGITEEGGFPAFLHFAGILSMILAVMNLLPIPGLDGGHIMFLLYEGITRRKPNPTVEGIANTIGFVTVVLLIFILIFKDAIDMI
jgi:regulator of sigma E protease